MPKSGPQPALIVATCVALVVVVAVGIASATRATSPPPPVAESESVGQFHLGVGSLLDRRVPDFSLVDERGTATRLSSFEGRYLVFAPAMTLCHEVCPMTAAALERIEATTRRLGVLGDVTVAEISVDPWRDTPGRLRAYERLSGVHFRMLTGRDAQLRRFWKFFGVYFKRVPQGHPPDSDWLTHEAERMDVEHSDGFFILDPSGRWRVAAAGMPSVGGLSARLRRLLNDQGRADLRHPQSPWKPAQVIDDLINVKEHDDAESSLTVERGGAPTPPRARDAPRLIGGTKAFRRRLAALRGRPVVVNEWASWCVPCRSEFPLFARAAAKYRRRVAFLGVNVSDQADNARAFLSAHAVSYPSYSDPDGSIAASFGNAAALPTTIFFTARGRRISTHIGQYTATQALDSDIARYALNR